MLTSKRNSTQARLLTNSHLTPRITYAAQQTSLRVRQPDKHTAAQQASGDQ